MFFFRKQLSEIARSRSTAPGTACHGKQRRRTSWMITWVHTAPDSDREHDKKQTRVSSFVGFEDINDRLRCDWTWIGQLKHGENAWIRGLTDLRASLWRALAAWQNCCFPGRWSQVEVQQKLSYWFLGVTPRFPSVSSVHPVDARRSVSNAPKAHSGLSFTNSPCPH